MIRTDLQVGQTYRFDWHGVTLTGRLVRLHGVKPWATLSTNDGRTYTVTGFDVL